jgi:hypothetical protein
VVARDVAHLRDLATKAAARRNPDEDEVLAVIGPEGVSCRVEARADESRLST